MQWQGWMVWYAESEKQCSPHWKKMKAVLLHADKKKSITEEIKKQTKPSIVEALRRGMEEQRKKDSEKQAQEKQKKQNMEL